MRQFANETMRQLVNEAMRQCTFNLLIFTMFLSTSPLTYSALADLPQGGNRIPLNYHADIQYIQV